MKKLLFKFLNDLKNNNNREWFNDHKKEYEAARNEMEHFVDHLILNIKSFDPSLGDLTAKQTMFRIYRDIRFSKDKTPYKTFFGAYMAPGGRKSDKAGYYVHLSADDSFVGGGSHNPVGENLKKIRSEIYYNLNEFDNILNKPGFKKAFGDLKGEKLTRPPLGFPKDFKGIELLKLKDFTVFQRFDEEEVVNPDFDEKVLGLFREMKPFNDFMNKALAG